MWIRGFAGSRGSSSLTLGESAILMKVSDDAYGDDIADGRELVLYEDRLGDAL